MTNISTFCHHAQFVVNDVKKEIEKYYDLKGLNLTLKQKNILDESIDSLNLITFKKYSNEMEESLSYLIAKLDLLSAELKQREGYDNDKIILIGTCKKYYYLIHELVG
ncbi:MULTISPECIES: hypothetical protein [unclassified Enterococcus]|uniref:hypothetical protein n=1 Tax=unclassified Enterococcus TaxID=2608891 RepID=UPI001555A254|nr:MULTISPECIES: hypothetical protein [unclassified Enterococcus]MBS7576956.1 hypothetical protein [Enterococcus sp. MMGLQ5-2]MBS7584363.1 hypothetical protein [Enterococcus sp. MMGLQ5-1]NPD12218.1 hypothetical protein [Enterococcus sp. MMGLQ5-1]NPD36790.1 hypothetical protein [Enterococcus sp. MMGLQ5-2]